MAFQAPLFPLGSVLFPGMPLLLHVFEERYRIMVARSVEDGTPIGIFAIREGREALGPMADPYRTGTLARIRSVHRLPDGRSHVELSGEQKIILLSYQVNEDGYAIGNCAECEEEPSTLPDEESRRSFDDTLRGLIEPGAILPSDPILLCHTALRLIDLPLPEKQRLLELNRFEDRWTETAAHMKRKAEYRTMTRRLTVPGSSGGPSLN